MSATPLDKSPIDIWGQLRFVDPTVFGEDFGPFRDEFCYFGGFKNHEIKFKQELMPRFLKRIERCVFRLEKKFLNLPPLQIHPVPVVLFGEQDRIYRRMETHGIVDVDGVVIPAPLVITRKAKLEQITGGTLLDQDGNCHRVGDSKLRKLRTMIKQLKPPVVVFCKYLNEIPLIMSALPSTASKASLSGAVIDNPRDKLRTDLINYFQAGKIDYLVCQMRTGGVSIELTAASTLIFYSMNFSFIDFEQVVGRFHRGSQTRAVDVYLLYAVDTRDEEIISEIERKKTTFMEVVDHFTRQPPPTLADAAPAR